MMVSRFTKAFQLIALVLAFSVAQVYVMAGPIRSVADPKTPDTSSASQPKAGTVAAADSFNNKIATTATASSESQSAPEAAAEKMALRLGSKTTLSRIFSKRDVEERVAAGNTFLKANTSAAATFKATSSQTSTTKTSSDDSDDTGRRGTWIAVGVIAAVLTIVVIGLRHDRSHPGQ
ncbi:MAG: hypothetical protein QOH63_376 [Acidobacteriota bacterium]|jgi:hypothetical protein|nr:hypothetical protein [Acidobacteriota bacterium]